MKRMIMIEVTILMFDVCNIHVVLERISFLYYNLLGPYSDFIHHRLVHLQIFFKLLGLHSDSTRTFTELGLRQISNNYSDFTRTTRTLLGIFDSYKLGIDSN